MFWNLPSLVFASFAPPLRAAYGQANKVPAVVSNPSLTSEFVRSCAADGGEETSRGKKSCRPKGQLKIRGETVHEGTPTGTPELHKDLIVMAALLTLCLQTWRDATPVGGFGELHPEL